MLPCVLAFLELNTPILQTMLNVGGSNVTMKLLQRLSSTIHPEEVVSRPVTPSEIEVGFMSGNEYRIQPAGESRIKWACTFQKRDVFSCECDCPMPRYWPSSVPPSCYR